jgi:hypothetical protein
MSAAKRQIGKIMRRLQECEGPREINDIPCTTGSPASTL